MLAEHLAGREARRRGRSASRRAAASSTFAEPTMLTRIVVTGLLMTVSMPAIAAQCTTMSAPVHRPRPGRRSRGCRPRPGVRFGCSRNALSFSELRERLSYSDDLVVVDQAARQGRADEPGPAGDEDPLSRDHAGSIRSCSGAGPSEALAGQDRRHAPGGAGAVRDGLLALRRPLPDRRAAGRLRRPARRSGRSRSRCVPRGAVADPALEGAARQRHGQARRAGPARSGSARARTQR